MTVTEEQSADASGAHRDQRGCTVLSRRAFGAGGGPPGPRSPAQGTPRPAPTSAAVPRREGCPPPMTAIRLTGFLA